MISGKRGAFWDPKNLRNSHFRVKVSKKGMLPQKFETRFPHEDCYKGLSKVLCVFIIVSEKSMFKIVKL